MAERSRAHSARDTLAKGAFWYACLHQRGPDAKWRPEQGDVMTLEQMTPGHRANLLAWLRARHRRIVSLAYWGACDYHLGPPMGVVDEGGQPTGQTVRLGEPQGDMARDLFDDMIDNIGVEMLDNPAEWFERTPFVSTLRQMVLSDQEA